MRFGLLALFLAAPFVAMSVWSYSVRRWAPDTKIDDLIAANRAHSCAGMELIDWQKANRASDRTWHQTLRAQRRYATVMAPAPKGHEGRVN